MNMSDTHESQTAQEPPNEPSTRAEPASAPDDLAPPLLSLIASIRAGVVRGASAEVRAAGATACRAILSVLEAKPGQPLAATPSPANPPTSPIMALLSQPGLLSKLAAMSREQLLDLLKQVTGGTSTGSQTPASAGPRFHIVEVPGRGAR
jgi:hypothetical protein